MKEMEDTLKKRRRTENYTTGESLKLLEFVRKYHQIVENKKTDAYTWKKKDQVWERISQEYNCCISNKRTAKLLRSKYETLKRDARKYVAAQKQSSSQTDGSTPVRPNMLLDMVQEIVSLECPSGVQDIEMPAEAVTVEAANTTDRSCEAAEAIPELLSFEMDVPVISSESLQNCSYISEPNAEEHALQKSPAADEVGNSSAAGTCPRCNRPWHTKPSSVSGQNLNSCVREKLSMATLQQQLLREQFTQREKREQELHEYNVQIKKTELEIKQVELMNRRLDIKIKRKAFTTFEELQ